MTHTISGLVPILATPFSRGGALELPGLRRMTEFVLAGGADGVAVSGMASETFALTTAERQTVLTEVVDVVGGSVPVVAGINATSAATAVEQIHAAQSAGAKALMVLPPYMVKPSPAQLVDFYATVAGATDLEVMVQDAPGPTGVQMGVELIAQLADVPGITSVKVEAPPSAPKVGAVVDAVGRDDFAVLGGNNAQFCLEEHARGAVGTMPACEFVDLLAPVLRSWAAGERVEARRAFAQILPLVLAGLQPGLAWAVHKEVLVRRGVIEHATVRPPAKDLDRGTRAALAEMLDALEVAV